MPDWVASGPLPGVVAFLFVVVFCRAQATYWLGRAVAAGLLRSRWAKAFTGPRATRAAESIDRWGLPIISLSFLTIGFQSAVNGAAGVMRMRWHRYTFAMLPGCAIWAVVYALGGLAAFRGAAALAARSPWALAGVLALLGAVAGVLALRRRRLRSARESVEALADAPNRSE